MLFKKLIRTIFKYKAQFISMIIMVLLGVGLFVGFQGEWYSIEKDTDYFYETTGFADYRLVNEKGYTKDDLEKIKNIDGIDNASLYLSLNTNESKENDVVSVSITSNIDVSGFMVTSGDAYDNTKVNDIWVSDMYAKANNYNIGDTINLKYGAYQINGTIKGLIKSSEYLICTPGENQMMPDYKTYGYAYISPLTFKEKIGIEFYTEIHAISKLSKNDFSSKVNAALGKTNMILTKDEITSYSEAKGEAKEGRTMASILPVVFLGIAILIMVTTMQRLVINEKTQIGTLKALGFRDNKIIKHYTLFGLFIGIIGALIGTLFGYFISWFIFNPNGSMGTYFDLPSWNIYVPWWTFLVVALVVVFMTIISYLSVKRTLKGNAADALKPYTPKAMKRLKIENSKGWRKLKFATKWNLRDLFRHKSRSFMTLFGIFGCTIMLVASFLMWDSMVGFVNKFYYGAMNYETEISLDNNVDNNKAKEMAIYFDGDYVASSVVSLNDEAISLDVYNITHDNIRFINDNMDYVNIEDNGVYLGQRLIESNNLKLGDNFKVSLFGTDEVYELKLAGVLRTLTKGIVMSENYAIKQGIDYKISQIYTNKSYDDVKNDNLYTTNINTIKNKADIVKSFDSFMEVMYLMIAMLIIFSIILGIVVLYNLGTMSYFERYRELSTLKVVGFRDKRIGNLLITQNMWLTIVGYIIGFPSGLLLTKILMKALASEYEMKLIFGWMTFIIPIILVFGVSLLVSLMISKKNKKINMVEALKVAE